MAVNPGIAETEHWAPQTTRKERCGGDVPFQLADSEIRPSPSDPELAGCPVVHQQDENGCNFVTLKTGNSSYHCQLFHRG